MKYKKEVIEHLEHVAKQCYEDWMDSSDREEIFKELISIAGDNMDEAIQQGIDNGYSLKTQMNIMKRTRLVDGKIKIVIDQPNSEIMIN